MDAVDSPDTREEPSFGEGARLDEPAWDDLVEALEAAFDYRGDVTLFLRDGSEVDGYIFRLRIESSGEEPALEMFPRGSDDRRRILLADLRGIHFSGRDTASGKSWQAWVKHYREKHAAREGGEDVGSIGIDPDPLD